ncbi:hypothetical protein F4861DRAFT_380050 [Xylaria intraflava]|nr:hypothetical protein F4861DRAFT_380050 [Xylaria intraflava]
MACWASRLAGAIMQDVNPSTPTPESAPLDANMIRAANESDIEAIVEVETTSFPEVYTDTHKLAECRRREVRGRYPYHGVLAAGPEIDGQTTIYGLVTLESYLLSRRWYHDSATGEGIEFPANRPPEKKPAYDILMAATRVDPALLDEEFLFISEICIHPRERQRGNGTRLMRHVVRMADELAVKIIVLVEGSVSDAARHWEAEEAENVDSLELAVLRQKQQRTAMPFYEEKLGFKRRAHFFWGRQNYATPRIFHVMQYPACQIREPHER